MTAKEFAEFIYNVPAFALGQTELAEEQFSKYSTEIIWVIKNHFSNDLKKRMRANETEEQEAEKEVILTIKKILFDADCLAELNLTVEQAKENFVKTEHSDIEIDSYTGSFKEVNGSTNTHEQWEHTGNGEKDNEFVYHDDKLQQYAILRKNRNGFNYVVVYDKQEVESEETQAEA
jgi:hypothetical protein